MSRLSDHPALRRATLPDGREITICVGVPAEPYLDASELDLVTAELREGDRPIASVETPLEPDDADEALLLAERIREVLESGAVEPTADGIEHLALTPPA